MLAVSLGPLALPLAPLLLLLAVATAAGVAALWLRRSGRRAAAGQASDALTTAALLGLLGARLAYLALHAPAYLSMPWAALDIRDGGWQAPAGWAVAAAWLGWRSWRAPLLRPALGLGAGAGVVAWGALTWAAALQSGATMPALRLAGLDGGAPRTLAQAAAGKPAVVVLWASWCAPCREELPLLVAAQQREPDLGFVFVNQGEDEAVVRAFLGRQSLALRQVLLDRAAALGPAVGSPGLPTTLFYNAEGRQVDAHFGVLNAAALESRLWPLRRGAPRLPGVD